MTDIPKARAILEVALAGSYTEAQWRKAAQEALGLMTRKPTARRRNSSERMTPELAEKIRARHARTNFNNNEIGKYFNVNPGRVTEALQGKY